MARRFLQPPPIVRQDISEALVFTRARFGDAKALEYVALIKLALQELTKNPRAGRHRPDLDPDVWVMHIGKPGRNARHLFLYEIVDEKAQLYGFFYDGMDLPTVLEGRKNP
ncbi:MAG: type II toxin-antitoxin system RelE/ParE family toxin [Polyangiaceae bacterium]